MILTATRRSIDSWNPRNTAPIPPRPSRLSSRYLSSSTWPSRAAAEAGVEFTLRTRSESHAVLDPEREPVPGEVGRPGEAGHGQHDRRAHDCESDRATRSSGGDDALALGDDLVALDERAHGPNAA